MNLSFYVQHEDIGKGNYLPLSTLGAQLRHLINLLQIGREPSDKMREERGG